MSLAVLLVVFELRYVWYVDSTDLQILRGGFTAGALVLVVLWVFFPSKIAIAVIGLVILLFPNILPEHRLPISTAFAALVLFCIALLVAAGEVRRRIGFQVNE